MTTFFRLLHAEDKEAALLSAIGVNKLGKVCPELFHVDPLSFARVPGSPFAYWVGEKVRALFVTLPPVESGQREVRVGGQTSDDFRFLRLFWELSLRDQQRCWKPYQKGGDFARYYSDIPLVADWDSKRQTYRGFEGRIGRPNIIHRAISIFSVLGSHGQDGRNVA